MTRPLIDHALLVLAALLMVAGPVMALQEAAEQNQLAAAAQLTGALPAPDYAFRVTWRGGLFIASLLVSVLGSLVLVRVGRAPRTRAVSGRLLSLLFAGMTVLDLAFLADGAWFLSAPYLVRAVTIVWAYPLAGALLFGSVLRLHEVETAFGASEPPPLAGREVDFRRG